MATKTASNAKATQGKQDVKEPALTSAWNTAWAALSPIRQTWTEKEQALMAQTNDSISGNITAARVSDAALSTLAYERQARVTAQLPTGRFYSMSRKASQNSALLNICLNNYIIPNADSQFDFLIKLRLWGVYASVYGSMFMMYDYRVDKRYVGPDCWLIDPRCIAPVDGMHNIQDAGGYVSTIMYVSELEDIVKRDKTSYDKAMCRKLITLIKNSKSKPSKDNNQQKTNTTVGQRYDLSNAKDRCEIVTKYTHSKWVSFAPDFAGMDRAGEDFIIRDMDNPHQSGRIPIVGRHCFPLLNSFFGLGDFERGMKIQKAKDSIINLFLEGAKMRVYPPLKMIDNQLTPSTIKYQAGTKWKVKNQQAVEAMSFGQAPLAEFQATYASLQGMLQNQFGTSDTTLTQQDGPEFGKSPQALKMQASRENARDTWDRFMGEKAIQELLEGMAQLLTVKMEKPINFAVFEDDLRALGYQSATTDENGKTVPEKKVDGLQVFEDGKAGKLTVNKSMLQPNKDSVGYQYIIDANSTMKQDEEEQFQALMATWNLTHQTPGLVQSLAQSGIEYDEADHLKKIFIGAGINDWDQILKENPALLQKLQAAKQGAPQPGQPGQPGMDPSSIAAAAAGGQIPQGPPQGAPQGMPPQAPMQPMQPQQMPTAGPPMGPQAGAPQFEDPQIAALAQQMLMPAGGAR